MIVATAEEGRRAAADMEALFSLGRSSPSRCVSLAEPS